MQHQIIDILANEITKRYNEIIEHMIDELQNDQTTLYD